MSLAFYGDGIYNVSSDRSNSELNPNRKYQSTEDESDFKIVIFFLSESWNLIFLLLDILLVMMVLKRKKFNLFPSKKDI